MTLTTKILAGLVLLLAVMACGLGMLWRHDAAALTQARQDIKTLKLSQAATDAALDAKDKALKAAKEKARKSQQELSDALKANPDWSSTSVPGSVWDGLLDGTKD